MLLNVLFNNQHLLVIGSSTQAQEIVRNAILEGARITHIDAAPISDCPETQYDCLQRPFEHKDVQHDAHRFGKIHFVFCCVVDPAIGRFVSELCREADIMVSCLHHPKDSDALLVKQVQNQFMTLSLHLNDAPEPLVDNLLNQLYQSVPSSLETAVLNVKHLLVTIKKVSGGDAVTFKKHMDILFKACQNMSMEELVDLSEDEIFPDRRSITSRYSTPRLPLAKTPLLRAEMTPSTFISMTTRPLQVFNAKIGTPQMRLSEVKDRARDDTLISSIRGLSMELSQSSLNTPSLGRLDKSLDYLPSVISTPLRETFKKFPGFVKEETKKGKIVFVGMGPGDPELLTMSAHQAFKQADLIVADISMPSFQFNFMEQFVGRQKFFKVPKGKKERQAFNSMLYSALHAGKIVVRCKSGDPFVFGAASTEALIFHEAGFDVEVIPGISSITGALSSNIIPLTHSDVATQVLILNTSSEDFAVPEYSQTRTLIICLENGQVSSVISQLRKRCYPPKTPVCLLERGTWSDQESILRTSMDLLEDYGLKYKNPSLICVGKVAAFPVTKIKSTK
jgi:siroheme synthase/siroheme synthase (precorrin-2 oxidase/ferrochelatase)